MILYLCIAPSLARMNVVPTSFENPEDIRMEFDRFLESIVKYIPTDFEEVGIDEDEMGK